MIKAAQIKEYNGIVLMLGGQVGAGKTSMMRSIVSDIALAQEVYVADEIDFNDDESIIRSGYLKKCHLASRAHTGSISIQLTDNVSRQRTTLQGRDSIFKAAPHKSQHTPNYLRLRVDEASVADTE